MPLGAGRAGAGGAAEGEGLLEPGRPVFRRGVGWSEVGCDEVWWVVGYRWVRCVMVACSGVLWGGVERSVVGWCWAW